MYEKESARVFARVAVDISEREIVGMGLGIGVGVRACLYAILRCLHTDLASLSLPHQIKQSDQFLEAPTSGSLHSWNCKAASQRVASLAQIIHHRRWLSSQLKRKLAV